MGTGKFHFSVCRSTNQTFDNIYGVNFQVFMEAHMLWLDKKSNFPKVIHGKNSCISFFLHYQKKRETDI